jgi:hypothetical protein
MAVETAVYAWRMILYDVTEIINTGRNFWGVADTNRKTGDRTSMYVAQ